MRLTFNLPWLYLLSAAVLITHEIDSAYWHEWALFGIPGGIQAFVGLNLVVVILILYGHQALVLGRTSGLAFSWMLAVGNLFAAVIHAYFLLRGLDAFRLPASLALLVAAFVLSLLQAAALVSAQIGNRKQR